jgi:pyrroline-5-carboxylate reductase
MGTKLVVVGGGKMGEALIGGLLAAGWAQAVEITVVEPVEARRDELNAGFPGVVTVAALPVDGDAALVAVKPQHVEEVCRSLRGAVRGPVLSIAAGVPLAKLETWLGAGCRVVRAMPNMPALVGAGASAIAAGVGATEADMKWAESILGAVGTVERVGEPLLDAVTGLSGSGPAYVFLVAEALIEAGVLVGLPRATARALAVQTLAGSALLLRDSGEDPAKLRADVTSPGGTTAAGLRALEQHGVRSAFLDAVSAATQRSRELGA